MPNNNKKPQPCMSEKLEEFTAPLFTLSFFFLGGGEDCKLDYNNNRENSGIKMIEMCSQVEGRRRN